MAAADPNDEKPAVADSCGVCGRGILRGERTHRFYTGESEVDVCELCRPRAQSAGWVPAHLVGEVGVSQSARPRRSRSAKSGVAGLFGERAKAAKAAIGRVAEATGPRSENEDDIPTGPERPNVARVRRALEAFNRSDHPRTVAGLARSLGEPRASAVAIGSKPEEPVRITVAWELSWYQWEVTLAGTKALVRERSKGSEVTQLGAADRSWNAEVKDRGRIKLTNAAPTPDRPEPSPQRSPESLIADRPRSSQTSDELQSVDESPDSDT